MCVCVCMHVNSVGWCVAQQVGSAAVRCHCGTPGIQGELGGELAHFLTMPASTATQLAADPHSRTTVNLFHFHVMECTMEYRLEHMHVTV